MTSQASISALLHLQGLPPLPRSLTKASYPSQPTVLMPTPSYASSPAQTGFINPLLASKSNTNPSGRPPPPVPPPRPNSRARSASSAGSSFRASPEHIVNRATTLTGLTGLAEMKRGSPLSLSSSPYPDSGVGRSSAESFSEPKAFVRVVKPSEHSVGDPKMDAQLLQLKKDMQHLRQQDVALLGHLLQIHQGIQDLRHILVPPPQPAPSSFRPLPMFQSTPSYPTPGSRNLRKQSHPSTSSSSSRLSMFSSGAKFFSRRSSADKLMSDSMKVSQELGACGGIGTPGKYSHIVRRGDDSDSLSSLEFGDV